MEYFVEGNDLHFICNDFNLAETLDCGQAFRWEAVDSGYMGWAMNNKLLIEQHGNEFVLKNTTERAFLALWKNYFDLDTDYSALKELYSSDETLKKACEYAGGIRLLRQDSWECLVSFIISQNNNIPRIKGIIAKMCDMFRGFPSPEKLAKCTAADLEPMKAGFRAKYIIDAAQMVNSGVVNLEHLKTAPIDLSRAALMTITGVGPKVAECVLLYGCHRVEAFPVDVWIKRVMAEYYPNGLPENLKDTAGIAQQFLFHYIRTNKSK